MKLRLDFLFTEISQHFGTDMVVFELEFLIHGHEKEVRYSKVICAVILKIIQPQPKYKTRNFQNLIRKRLLRDFIETKK